jgi:hypothetical protein
MLISPLLSQLAVPTHTQAKLGYLKHNDRIQNCGRNLRRTIEAIGTGLEPSRNRVEIKSKFNDILILIMFRALILATRLF